MASSGFPTPFAINTVKSIPGPAGPSGSTGAAGPGQGIDCTTKGCVGDGTTDNTAGFALAATAASSDPSRTVYVPAGTYKLASTQTLSANLRFAPGAILKPASGQTVTVSGQVSANEYAHIFDISLGGSISFDAGFTGSISPCWFGADPNMSQGAVGTNAAAIQAAIDSSPVTHDSGEMTIPIHIPSGQYPLEKPLVITANNTVIRGDGMFATNLINRHYAGPAILSSLQGLFTVIANDYAGGNAVVLRGADSLHLNHLGTAWQLDGRTAFCLEFIYKPGSQVEDTTYILGSTGTGGQGADSAEACFNVALQGGSPYSRSNNGIQWSLTTASGVVSATTAAGCLASGSYHIVRLDYDGSDMRVFVDGVAQTLTNADTKIAQTGVLRQFTSEAVVFNRAYMGGYDGWNPIFNCPVGSVASLRMGYTSRGTTNYSPSVAKFSEDSDTKFLINFDVLQAKGGLHFARAYSDVFGMLDAWIPNESDGTQLAATQISDLHVECDNGVGILLQDVPQAVIRHVGILAKFGINLSANCYNSTVELCNLSSSGGIGTGLRIGNASNFCVVRDCHISSFSVSLYSESMYDTEGWNYFSTPTYCGIFNEAVLLANIKNVFLSDEGGPDALYGMISRNCGSIHCDGVLFGMNQHTDQTQAWCSNISGSSSYGGSHFKFTTCSFGSNPGGLPNIRLTHLTSADDVTLSSCDTWASLAYLSVDSTSLARITIDPWEHEPLALTLSDADTTLTNDQWQYSKLVFSGTLTADRNIIVPTLAGYSREIQNKTAFALLVKTSAGAGVYVPPGITCGVSCDGTNIILDWQSDAPLRVISAGTSSTAKDWDQIVSLKLSGTYDLTTAANPKKGQPLIVKDQQGDAGTNTKTITANSGQTIDGSTTATITTNFGRVSLVFDGVSDWMS